MNENRYDNVIKPVTSQYQDLDTELVTNLSKYISRGKITLEQGNVNQWVGERMRELAPLTVNNRGAIADVSIPTIKQDVMKELVSNENEYLKAEKLGANIATTIDLSQSIIITVLDNKDAILKAETFTAKATMLKSANSQYISLVNSVATEFLKGEVSYDKAMRKVASQLANGIPLIDKVGRKWGIDTYMNMLMRTTLQQATTEAQMIRADEWGADLIEVSSHANARPLCEPYQGKIFSRNGNSKKYPSLSTTSYGQKAGLFGINCRHSWYPFFEGISEQTFEPYKKKEVDENYKLSQQQRSLERNIRKDKRELRILETMKLDTSQQRMKLSNSEAKMEQFIEQTGLKRKPTREEIV